MQKGPVFLWIGSGIEPDKQSEPTWSRAADLVRESEARILDRNVGSIVRINTCCFGMPSASSHSCQPTGLASEFNTLIRPLGLVVHAPETSQLRSDRIGICY